MTYAQRVALSTLWGALLGLIASAMVASSLSYAIDKPITGCAFITIALAFVTFGALAGASTKDIAL